MDNCGVNGFSHAQSALSIIDSVNVQYNMMTVCQVILLSQTEVPRKVVSKQQQHIVCSMESGL